MKKKISIEGMSCEHCVMHVTQALEEIGATDVKVSLKQNSATAVVNEGITDEKIKAAIEDAGYDVTAIENI